VLLAVFLIVAADLANDHIKGSLTHGWCFKIVKPISRMVRLVLVVLRGIVLRSPISMPFRREGKM